MGQPVPQQPVHRLATARSTFKWVALVATGALLIGTAPAAGVQDGIPVATATASRPSAPVVSPVYAIPESSPLLDPAVSSAWAATWTPGYQPGISSEVGPDGSARNGEGISGSGGALHVATGRAGLLPGGLALSAPVASTRITSGFGWRLNPTGPGSYIHIGQDYGVPCGTPVRAAEDGTVVQSAWAGHSGQRIRVDHGSGVETAYSHNSLLVARVGDTVRRGDLLALSGTTGNSTGCHVHFEVYLNGKWVDPALYLPLLPGQSRPVSEDERQQISRTRDLPAGHHTAGSSPSPRPEPRVTTSAPATSPTPQAAAPVRASRPAGPERNTPSATHPAGPAPTAAPAEPTGQTPAPPSRAPTTPPSESPDPTPPAPTPSAPPADPGNQPSTPPSQTPTTPPAESPGPTPPAPAPSDSPADPGNRPSTPPSQSPTAPPSESPDPTPPAPTPTPSEPPADPSSTPPTLGALCLAYQLEGQSTATGPADPGARELSPREVALLGATLASRLPEAPALAERPTVHAVEQLCPTWFPQGIGKDTVPADLDAVRTGELAMARAATGSSK